MPNMTTPYKNLPPELRAYVDSRDPSDKLLAAAAGWGLDKLAQDAAPDAGPAKAMAAARMGADDALAAFSAARSQDVAAVLALRGIAEPRQDDSPFVHAAAAERTENGVRAGKRLRYGDGGHEGGATEPVSETRRAPVPCESIARGGGNKKTGGAR